MFNFLGSLLGALGLGGSAGTEAGAGVSGGAAGLADLNRLVGPLAKLLGLPGSSKQDRAPADGGGGILDGLPSQFGGNTGSNLSETVLKNGIGGAPVGSDTFGGQFINALKKDDDRKRAEMVRERSLGDLYGNTMNRMR